VASRGYESNSGISSAVRHPASVRLNTVYALVALALLVGLVEPFGCVAHCQLLPNVLAGRHEMGSGVVRSMNAGVGHQATAAVENDRLAPLFLCDFRPASSGPENVPVGSDHVHVHEHLALVLVVLTILVTMQVQRTPATPRYPLPHNSAPPLLPPPIRVALHFA
jgi:hypothetical protein